MVLHEAATYITIQISARKNHKKAVWTSLSHVLTTIRAYLQVETCNGGLYTCEITVLSAITHSMTSITA